MQDRMTVSAASRWQKDVHPPIGHIVRVWYWAVSGEVDVQWDGAQWRTPDGRILTCISHWKERHA